MSDYFSALEGELSAAAGRRPRRARRGRRALLLAAAVLVVAGVPAAAVTGVFTKNERRNAADRVFHEPPIGEGRTPSGARWQLLGYERGGTLCFGIALPTGDPRELQPGGGAGCGDHEPGELTVSAASSTRGRHSPPGPRHRLAFGTAPDAAVSVELTVGTGRVVARTFDDPKGIPGRFYVAEIPFRWLRERRHARAYDASGEVVARAGG